MRTIDAIAQILKQEGIEYLSAFPTTPVIEAAAVAGIRPIICRQERVGVGIGDGYARVTGKPGVALVVPGPGVQNASAALGTAYSASSPVLLLAGQVESYNVGYDRGALHEINDQQDVIRPVRHRRVDTT